MRWSANSSMRHAVELWHGVILSSIRLGKTIRVRIASTTPMDDVYGFNVPTRSTNLYGSYTVLHLRKKWTNLDVSINCFELIQFFFSVHLWLSDSLAFGTGEVYQETRKPTALVRFWFKPTFALFFWSFIMPMHKNTHLFSWYMFHLG